MNLNQSKIPQRTGSCSPDSRQQGATCARTDVDSYVTAAEEEEELLLPAGLPPFLWETCCGFVWASLDFWIRLHVDPNQNQRRTNTVREIRRSGSAGSGRVQNLT
ncbi:hypothetical protein OJAV_G00164120 [Oryzias javanicus]|uniref:Uncharacterized protein n=1 Tax=Oryzias javanicus TaxID=123683 RepID=A0A437CL41_ORYJA|nr:hypothetical protein OJAV_G00164120 [Oryzias javanicus]